MGNNIHLKIQFQKASQGMVVYHAFFFDRRDTQHSSHRIRCPYWSYPRWYYLCKSSAISTWIWTPASIDPLDGQVSSCIFRTNDNPSTFIWTLITVSFHSFVFTVFFFFSSCFLWVLFPGGQVHDVNCFPPILKISQVEGGEKVHFNIPHK